MKATELRDFSKFSKGLGDPADDLKGLRTHSAMCARQVQVRNRRRGPGPVLGVHAGEAGALPP